MTLRSKIGRVVGRSLGALAVPDRRPQLAAFMLAKDKRRELAALILGACGQLTDMAAVRAVEAVIPVLIRDAEHWEAWATWAAVTGNGKRERIFIAFADLAREWSDKYGTPGRNVREQARVTCPPPPLPTGVVQ